MVTARRTLVTEEEFLAMPVSLDKIELIDGEILVSPAPTVGHQWLQGEFFGELRAWSRACREPFTVLGAPSDVRFGKDRRR